MIEEEQQEATIQGPGQILKLARDRAGLTSQDIANKLKLKKVVIEDLEQDNYDINISLTFIKGYLKLYAKYVQVDESEIIKAFENLSTQSNEPAKMQSFSRRVAHQANDDKLMLVTYFIVAVVIALVVLWWFQENSAETLESSNLDNTTEQTPTEIEPNIPVENTQTDSLIAATQSEQLDASNEFQADPLVKDSNDTLLAVNTQDQSQSEQSIIENQPNQIDRAMDATENDNSIPSAEVATLPELAELAAPVELVFEFADNCWMNLSDATGENIAYGVKVKGRVMPVTGIPPFVVTLGAPEVVKISYAGEPIDMSFLPAGRSAKFDLPLSE